jgi:hypothetical protein
MQGTSDSGKRDMILSQNWCLWLVDFLNYMYLSTVFSLLQQLLGQNYVDTVLIAEALKYLLAVFCRRFSVLLF